MQPGYSVSDKREENDPESRSNFEAPPAEGDVASAVHRKGHDPQVAQRTISVEDARGSGGPHVYEEDDLTADFPRREKEHQQSLEDRKGHAERGDLEEVEGGEEMIEREKVIEEKLKRDREINVSGAVREATGNFVAGE